MWGYFRKFILELKYFCQKCQNSKSDRCFFKIRKSGNENSQGILIARYKSVCDWSSGSSFTTIASLLYWPITELTRQGETAYTLLNHRGLERKLEFDSWNFIILTVKNTFEITQNSKIFMSAFAKYVCNFFRSSSSEVLGSGHWKCQQTMGRVHGG